MAVQQTAADQQEHGQLVGVLGGMGPAATADFYTKLVAATPAPRDQFHLRVVIWSDPRVPDRSDALLNNGPDPTRFIEQGAVALAALGCDLIAVPCNTAHAFIPRIAGRIGVPVVDMIHETASRLHTLAERIQRVGVLATTGTVTAGLYQHELGAWNVEVTTPSTDEQEALMRAIRNVKAGQARGKARKDAIHVARSLIDRGAEALVLGCTELPLLLSSAAFHVPVVDSAQCLAEAVVARAWQPTKQVSSPRRAQPAAGLSGPTVPSQTSSVPTRAPMSSQADWDTKWERNCQRRLKVDPLPSLGF